MIYTYYGLGADWTVTVTATVTATLKKEKRKSFESIFLNHILRWTMTCEASVGVSVKTVVFLSQTTFYWESDRLEQKISSYVEL